jgi:hypothetical protein
MSQFEMHQENCQRCNHSTSGVTIMSMFNLQVICIPCKTIEKAHKDYKKANDAEIKAFLEGDVNFKGIGLPKDLIN